MNKNRRTKTLYKNKNLTNRNFKVRSRVKEKSSETIIIKKNSLYKTIAIMFVIQIIAIVLLIPNIFDKFIDQINLGRLELGFKPIPQYMDHTREFASLIIGSAVSTFLPIPVLSPVDAILLGFTAKYKDTFIMIFLLGSIAIVADTIFAYYGYKFSHTLREKYVKDKELEESVTKGLDKYGNFMMFLGAATPLPFTLMIYAAGALRLNLRGFMIATFAGRTIKYTFIVAITVGALKWFGIDSINDLKNLALNFTKEYLLVIIIVSLIFLIALTTFVWSRIKKIKRLKTK